MTYVRSLVVAAALAGAVAGCGDPYYPSYPSYGYSQPSYGYSQATYYPSGYYAPAGYSYYPPPYSYSSYPPNYGYRSSTWDNGYAYRNYNGIHPGPERNFP